MADSPGGNSPSDTPRDPADPSLTSGPGSDQGIPRSDESLADPTTAGGGEDTLSGGNATALPGERSEGASPASEPLASGTTADSSAGRTPLPPYPRAKHMVRPGGERIGGNGNSHEGSPEPTRAHAPRDEPSHHRAPPEPFSAMDDFPSPRRPLMKQRSFGPMVGGIAALIVVVVLLVWQGPRGWAYIQSWMPSDEVQQASAQETQQASSNARTDANRAHLSANAASQSAAAAAADRKAIEAARDQMKAYAAEAEKFAKRAEAAARQAQGTGASARTAPTARPAPATAAGTVRTPPTAEEIGVPRGRGSGSVPAVVTPQEIGSTAVVRTAAQSGTKPYLWTQVGADPCNPKSGCTLVWALSQTGWPQSVQDGLISKVRSGIAETYMMQSGWNGWMTWGSTKRKFHPNTLAQWPRGQTEVSDLWTFDSGSTRYNLVRVAKCKNWGGFTSSAPAPRPLTIAPAPDRMPLDPIPAVVCPE